MPIVKIEEHLRQTKLALADLFGSVTEEDSSQQKKYSEMGRLKIETSYIYVCVSALICYPMQNTW